MRNAEEVHEAARRWLVTYDPEGAATWLAAGTDADLVMDVVQNLSTFGLADHEGDETAAKEGLDIVAASHRVHRAAALIRVATADKPATPPASHPGVAVVRLVGELLRDVYAASATPALGLKLVVDPMLFESVVRALSDRQRFGEPYRAGGELCVDIVTPQGPVTVAQGHPPHRRWRPERF